MLQASVTTQPAEKRTKSFSEVSLGYSRKVAQEEARRCPQCADPVCMEGCPLGVNIPQFIRKLREGQLSEAFNVIREANCLPSVCGRICTAPCESACILVEDTGAIGIRGLERYIADYGRVRNSRLKEQSSHGKKVAVVGSGPSGLAAANELLKKGFHVTIFESLGNPGGVLRYGVPAFRLPRNKLANDIDNIQTLGAEMKGNWLVGQTVTIDDLKDEGFSAVLLATGAGTPKFLKMPGTNLGGVYYGEEFLMRANLTKANFLSRHIPTFMIGQKIVVVGSGNTALDCARCAIRFGRDVTLLFRRTEEDMFVGKLEREWAREEGVKFEPLTKLIEIVGNSGNYVEGIKCVRMDYAGNDDSGEWELIPVDDSEFIIEADTVILAVGHKPNVQIQKRIPELKFNSDGTIEIDKENSMTSIPGVFACGNGISGPTSMVEAMADGKVAALQVADHLLGVNG